MKKIFKILTISLVLFFCANQCPAAQSFDEKKKEIIALYSSNNLEEAQKLISTVTEDERDYEIWFLLGNLAQDFNNNTNAAFFLQKSILLKPDFDKAHYNLGNIYLKEKRYNSAINEYKLAIKYKKDFPYYYYNLGCAYLEQKDYKNAKNAFKKAIKLKSEADFYYNLAICSKQLKNEKEAEEALDMYKKLKG